MIETITLRNYKGHLDTVVPCQRLTVLVGENAAGKTSVLEAVTAVRACNHRESLVLARRDLAARRRGGASEVSICVAGNVGEHRGSASATMSASATFSAVLQVEPSPPVPVSNEHEDVTDDVHGLLDLMIPQPTWLALEPHQLARPTKPRSVEPRPDASGFGLASALAHLKLSDTARFARIVEHLRAVVPVVAGIRFKRVELQERVPRNVRVEGKLVELEDTVTSIGDELRFDFVDGEDVPADFVSEGTLLALGIITALEYAERPQLVLIDDIDRALHPRAQRALVATLRRILESRQHLQVLATSHSPYLVDALEPEEVVLLGRDANSVIVAKRLDMFPDERLRKMLSTGELWMSEGEAWVMR